MDKNIPFKLNVSLFRRKQILSIYFIYNKDAITSESKELKDKG